MTFARGSNQPFFLSNAIVFLSSSRLRVAILFMLKQLNTNLHCKFQKYFFFYITFPVDFLKNSNKRVSFLINKIATRSLEEDRKTMAFGARNS
jgi:hypothetical protein